MTNPFHEDLIDIEDEFFEASRHGRGKEGLLDDSAPVNSDVSRQIEQMLDTITRIGGEVCRLRAEMDGLLDQNSFLTDSFQRLKDVMEEKGILDWDDFQLACDVFDESNKAPRSHFFKKATH
jgi:hypothetical protein